MSNRPPNSNTLERKSAPKQSSVITKYGQSVQIPKAAQIVASDLRRRIVRGEISDGHTLPTENVLMATYEVSRPTLREAMRILEGEHLITTSRGGNKGARVNKPSPRYAAQYAGLILQVRGAKISDVFRVRALIGPAAARIIAEQRPRPDITPLFECIDEMAASVDNPRERVRLLEHFDLLLYELSGNEVLRLIGQMMVHLIEPQLHLVPEHAERLPKQNIRDLVPSLVALRRIVDLIKLGRGKEAEALMRTRAAKTLANMLRSEAATSPLQLVD